MKRYPNYKDSGVEWLGEVPEHWEAGRFSRIIAAIKDGTHGTFARVSEGRPLLSAKNVQVGSIDIADDESLISEQDHEEIISNGFPQLNDLLLTIVGTIGRCCVYRLDTPLAFQRSVCFVRLIENQHADFYYYFTQSKFFQEQLSSRSKSAAQGGVYMGDVVALSIAYPPCPKEQAAIVSFLDRETAKIDGLVGEQRRLVELLKEKRQAVISHAVTKGLNPNAKLKPSGIDWLGDVPDTWTVKRLKHISPFITVGIVVNPSTYVRDEGMPFIYGGDIREGVIEWTNARCIDAASSRANDKTMLHAGDLLTVRVGAPGVTSVVPPECEGGNCASVMLVRQGDFNSHWLCHAMNTRVVRYQVEIVQYGAAQEQFNIAHAVNFWVPVPPRDEQDRIAKYILDETTAVDALAAAAQGAISLLQERRTALISAAVTGKIDVRNTVP